MKCMIDSSFDILSCYLNIESEKRRIIILGTIICPKFVSDEAIDVLHMLCTAEKTDALKRSNR